MTTEHLKIRITTKPILIEKRNSYMFYAELEKGSSVFVQLIGNYGHLKKFDHLTLTDYIIDLAAYYGMKRKIPAITALEVASYEKFSSSAIKHLLSKKHRTLKLAS